jgi:CubicO group peptidase (beta-lactamase class C family)
MRDLLFFLKILILSFTLNSCSTGSANQPSGKNGDDTLIYTLPPPGELNEAEILRYRNAVQSFFDTVLVPKGFNGSILVAKNGVVVFEKYYGYANLITKDTLKENSSFHLASVSKTFTAISILQLAEKRKLSLDDDVKKFFPGFPYDNVQVKYLLNHRSGLPNYMYFLPKLGWDVSRFSTNNDVVDYLLHYKPDLTSIPGTRFAYCNTNYVLLAEIIEKVTGTSYSDHLQKTIFNPLQMKDTYVFKLEDSNRVMPSYDYRGRPEPFTFLDAQYGDKNIYSTPRDLLKWDQALYTNQLVSEASLKAAFTPYSNEKPGIKNYGYGWRMDVFPDGKKIIFHGGWWHGNNTILVRAIQDTATIIVLGNKRNRVVYDAKHLVNIFSPYFTFQQMEKESGDEASVKSDSTADAKTDSTQQKAGIKKKK